MTQYDLETQWITPEGVDGVDFRFGDVVRVNKDELRDELYEVVALVSVTPKPLFIVTRVTDERSLTVLQEDLESVGENTGRKLDPRPPGGKPNIKNA